MIYILIIDLNDNEYRYKSKNFQDIVKFVKKHKGYVKKVQFATKE